MNTRNNTKRRSLCGGLLCLTLAFSACGDSRDKAQGPTATVQSAPPTTTLTAPTTSDQTTDATTVPTIVYDDSAAAEFWEPVPEGMTPAEFQPDVLTREEVTKYVELPNPNPADWDIPEEGITPEYIERVFSYILNLDSGLIRTGVAIGTQDPRVRESGAAIFNRGRLQGYFDALDQAATLAPQNQGQWRIATNVRITDLEVKAVADQRYPCVFGRITYDLLAGSAPTTRVLWVSLTRDSPPNWLNPTGWRQQTSAPAEIPDPRAYSCDLWESEQ